ncbi:AraC family transcriptional regulator [Prolixibacteraceae bacterium JC049]|nr:AraC family transcriptional regulator [Prolixibacteraceae bacterium JC049]
MQKKDLANSYYSQRVELVIDYIEENIDSKLHLEQLAEVALFSKYHFHRIFKSVTGDSLNTYIKRLRMVKAYRLLQVDKMLSIQELAIKTGYNSTANFSRDFKGYHGISPTQARNSDKVLEKQVTTVKPSKLNIAFKGIQYIPDHFVLFKKITTGYDTELIPKISCELYQIAMENQFNIKQFIGIGYDDPAYTPADKCKFDMCISVDKNELPTPLPCTSKTIKGGKFAVFYFQGYKDDISVAWDYLFKDWLVNSSYLPDDRPQLEMYLESEKYEQGYFNVNLCLPIKKIN